MTYKNAKTILFTGLIAAMILPFSGMDFADAAPNENANDKANNNRNFLEEWRTLETEVSALAEAQVKSIEKLQNSFTTDTILENVIERRALDIEALNQQIDDLEQESIESMKMPIELEEKLFGIERTIIANNSNQEDNPFLGAYVDFELQKVVVFVDADNILANQITESITREYGNYVVIDNNLPIETACAYQTSSCRPLIGGLALARYADPGNLAGTLGYKAQDASGNIGFVTAEHVVDYNHVGNTWMKQPVNGGLVGYATITGEGTSNLDFAFVKTTTSINDDVYKSYNTVMDVTGYATTHSQHYPGTFLYGKGVTSGEYSGTVNGYSSDGWYRLGGANPVGGDSGGPVYKKYAGAGGTYTVKIYGHMFNNAGFYGSVHGVIDNYDVTPLTS